MKSTVTFTALTIALITICTVMPPLAAIAGAERPEIAAAATAENTRPLRLESQPIPASELAGSKSLVIAQVDFGSYDAAAKNKRDTSASECLGQDAAIVKTGNSIVDMRCSLVAFEVCMNRKTGIISQSQEAKENCTLIKRVGGAGACKAPCDAVTGLPVGGDGVVGRYKGLTSAAVNCYDTAIVRAGKESDPGKKACLVSHAVTACLYNASSLPEVNAAILREATAGCQRLTRNYPDGNCQSCINWQLNHTN